MKVHSARFFLLIYLFSYTPLRELIKLPMLVTHYVYHAEASPGITVRHFFEMHYGKDAAHDADFQQDQQLPFKTTDVNTLPVFVLQNNRMIDLQPAYAELPEKNAPTAYLFCTSEAKLRGIFHPPQFA